MDGFPLALISRTLSWDRLSRRLNPSLLWKRAVAALHPPAPRSEPTALIHLNTEVPPKVEAHRVRRIAQAMLNGGVEHVYVTLHQSKANEAASGFPEQTLPNLLRSQHDTPLLLCRSDQYHLASSHVTRLLTAASNTRQNAEFDYRSAAFLGNMGVAFRAAALFPTAVRARDIDLHNAHFLSDKPMIAGDCQVTHLPVDDADIYAGYRNYAETTTPSTVVVELNSTCNLTCFYCPFHGDDKDHPSYVKPGTAHEMPIAEFHEVVAQVAQWRSPYEHHVTSVAPFWSGEFFIAENWAPALRVIKEHGLRSYVCTNASVLSEAIVDRLTSENLLDHLTISLEATDEALNRLIRRNKKYHHIVETIEHLLDLRARRKCPMVVALNFTLVDANKPIVEQYVNRWADRVDYILLGGVAYVPNGQEQAVFHPWPTEWQIPDVPVRQVPCTALYHTVMIDCHRNLQLCAPCGSKRYNIGVVQEGRKIWEIQKESVMYQKVAQMHRDGTFTKFPYCASCNMPRLPFRTPATVFGRQVSANNAGFILAAKAA